MPTPVETTIADLIAKDTTDNTNLYKVSGILEDKKNTDRYGNGYLTDPETGDSIMIYGSTTSAVEDVFSNVGGALDFENPETAVEELADINNGDYITMTVKYECYNGTDEIMGVITSHETSDRKYSVNIAPTENGSVTSDKEEYAYGETVSLAISPAENYRIGKVTVTNAWGGAVTTTIGENNTYTFAATAINNVTVTFESSTAQASNYVIKSIDLGLGKYPDEEQSKDLSVSGTTITFKYYNLGDFGNGIQSKQNGVLRNTTALPLAIDSIEFHYNSKQESTKSGIAVTFGTEEISSKGSTTNVKFATGETVDIVDCDVSDATFFRIDHIESGAFYFDSIVINFVVD